MGTPAITRARALADASRDMRRDFIVGIVCDSSRATPLATATAGMCKHKL